ncbi:hypothetical protein LINPERPRIM_LOCUS4971 [Linum perenne]
MHTTQSIEELSMSKTCLVLPFAKVCLRLEQP